MKLLSAVSAVNKRNMNPVIVVLVDKLVERKSRRSNEVEQSSVRVACVAHRAEVCRLSFGVLRTCCTADSSIELCASVARRDYQRRPPLLPQRVEQVGDQRRETRFRLCRRGVVYSFALCHLRGGEFLYSEVSHAVSPFPISSDVSPCDSFTSSPNSTAR